MKSYFKSEVDGKGFFKRYIAFLIPMIILFAISQRTAESMAFLSTIASIVQSYLSMLLWFTFFSYLIHFVFINNKGFSFTGSLKEVAPKFLKWYMLTLITLGIYSPWYIRNLINYYLSNTTYDGKKVEFLSRPGKLLKYMLLTLYLPFAVLTVMFVLVILRTAYNDYYSWAAVTLPTFIFVILMFLLIIPFMYYYLAWIVNMKFDDHKISFKRDMRETAAVLIPQILLSIITIGIYYPAAIVKIYRFLINGSRISDANDIEKGGLGFDGTAGKGFCRIWGQGLLSLITIGIYGPWAMSKVTNWFLNETCIEIKE